MNCRIRCVQQKLDIIDKPKPPASKFSIQVAGPLLDDPHTGLGCHQCDQPVKGSLRVWARGDRVNPVVGGLGET